MNIIKQSYCVVTALVLFLVAACGGSGGGSSETATVPESQPAADVRMVVGGFTKGPVAMAVINAYQVDNAGFKANQTPAYTAVTDAFGGFTLQLPPDTGMLLLESSGGEYIDEADQAADPANRRRITFGADEGLQVILPASATSVAMTIAGQALLEKARREAAGNNFAGFYNASRTLWMQANGFDIVTTLPGDPTSPSSATSLATRQYAMMLGGFANLLNRVAALVGMPEPNHLLIQAVISDFSDGRIDGLLMGNPIMVMVGQSSVPLPTNLSLNDEINRFRNNNFSAYAGTGLIVVNEAALNDVAQPPNNTPSAVDNAYEVDEGATLIVAAPGVLGNDFDIDGDPLTATLDMNTAPVNGQLVLAADGSFDYVHDGSETVSDSFSYVVSDDQGNTATATVTLTIIAINDDPVAQMDNYLVDEGATLAVAAPGVLGNDFDLEGDPLTAALNNGPVNGQLVLAANGSFEYVHDGSEAVSDSFSYVVSDNQAGTAIAVVELTIIGINDFPVAQVDNYDAIEGTTLNGSSVLANDTDAEGDPLTAVLVTDVSFGSLTFNPNGTFIYDTDCPAQSAAFTYFAFDGADNSAEVVVSISVALTADADGDGLRDGEEAALGTNPNVTDSDNDGLTDFDEILVDGDRCSANVVAGADTDPLNPDTDGDDVGDGVERQWDTNPHIADVVLHVSPNGDDLADGLSWSTAIQSNSEVGTRLLTSLPVHYILYAGGIYSELFLSGPGECGSASSEYHLVGSVGPGLFIPEAPLTTTFDAAGFTYVLSGFNCGLEATLQSLVLTNASSEDFSSAAVETGQTSRVTMHNIHVVNNQTHGVDVRNDGLELIDSLVAGNDGSPLLAFGELHVDNTVFANNAGAMVIDSAAPVSISNSKFLSNRGFNAGAIEIIRAEGQLTLFNNLIVGNRSAQGGAVNAADNIDSTNALSIIDLHNNTIAFNDAQDAAAGGYVASLCMTSTLRGNIISNNSVGPDQSDVSIRDPCPVLDFNFNVIQNGPMGDNGIAADPEFVNGFYLDQAISPAVDGDTANNADQVYGAGETTDPLGMPDTGFVDIGFHHRKGAQVSPDAASPDQIFPGFFDGINPVTATIPFGLTSAGVPFDEPGQLVGVCIGSATTATDATLSSVTNLDPVSSCNSVLARDLGTGQYEVDVSILSAGTLVLDVYVNGASIPLTFTSTPGAVTVCDQNATTCVQGAMDRFTDVQIEDMLAFMNTGVAGLDIIFEDDTASITWATPFVLELLAGRNVFLDGTITAPNGSLSVLFGQTEAGVFTLASTANVAAAGFDVSGGLFSDIFNINALLFGNLQGNAGDDDFMLTGGTVSGSIDGGAGLDSLFAANAATWIVNAVDGGTLNGSAFMNIENLSGGANNDDFVLMGGTVSGSINGGAGLDSLFADNAANTWIVNAVDGGTLNGSAFMNIENLSGGGDNDDFMLMGGTVSGFINAGAGMDSLFADNVANTWIVNAVDGGTLNGSAFMNIENLSGGGDNDDFMLMGGTVSGFINAGAGMDSLFADNVANTWIVNAVVGALNGIAFENFENLSGGGGDDTFMILPGGIINNIDGGVGSDVLDYSMFDMADNVVIIGCDDEGCFGTGNGIIGMFRGIDTIIPSPFNR